MSSATFNSTYSHFFFSQAFTVSHMMLYYSAKEALGHAFWNEHRDSRPTVKRDSCFK